MLVGNCMFVRSRAPEGGDIVTGLLFSSSWVESELFASSFSLALSFVSILRSVMSQVTASFLLLWCWVIFWRCSISAHKLTVGPPSAPMPRSTETTLNLPLVEEIRTANTNGIKGSNFIMTHTHAILKPLTISPFCRWKSKLFSFHVSPHDKQNTFVFWSNNVTFHPLDS